MDKTGEIWKTILQKSAYHKVKRHQTRCRFGTVVRYQCRGIRKTTDPSASPFNWKAARCMLEKGKCGTHAARLALRNALISGSQQSAEGVT